MKYHADIADKIGVSIGKLEKLIENPGEFKGREVEEAKGKIEKLKGFRDTTLRESQEQVREQMKQEAYTNAKTPEELEAAKEEFGEIATPDAKPGYAELEGGEVAVSTNTPIEGRTKGATTELSDDSQRMNGPSHDAGGIDVNLGGSYAAYGGKMPQYGYGDPPSNSSTNPFDFSQTFPGLNDSGRVELTNEQSDYRGQQKGIFQEGLTNLENTYGAGRNYTANEVSDYFGEGSSGLKDWNNSKSHLSDYDNWIGRKSNTAGVSEGGIPMDDQDIGYRTKNLDSLSHSKVGWPTMAYGGSLPKYGGGGDYSVSSDQYDPYFHTPMSGAQVGPYSMPPMQYNNVYQDYSNTSSPADMPMDSKGFPSPDAYGQEQFLRDNPMATRDSRGAGDRSNDVFLDYSKTMGPPQYTGDAYDRDNYVIPPEVLNYPQPWETNDSSNEGSPPPVTEDTSRGLKHGNDGSLNIGKYDMERLPLDVSALSLLQDATHLTPDYNNQGVMDGLANQRGLAKRYADSMDLERYIDPTQGRRDIDNETNRAMKAGEGLGAQERANYQEVLKNKAMDSKQAYMGKNQQDNATIMYQDAINKAKGIDGMARTEEGIARTLSRENQLAQQKFWQYQQYNDRSQAAKQQQIMDYATTASDYTQGQRNNGMLENALQQGSLYSQYDPKTHKWNLGPKKD